LEPQLRIGLALRDPAVEVRSGGLLPPQAPAPPSTLQLCTGGFSSESFFQDRILTEQTFPEQEQSVFSRQAKQGTTDRTRSHHRDKA